MKFQAPRGTRDILSPQAEEFAHIEEIARKNARLWSFKEIRCPSFEEAALFAKGVGEATDIVEHEMFTFEDRGGRQLALRPEGTAGTARAYIELSMGKQEPKTQWFYIGKMFRAEKPQAGRFREFEQVGYEVFGDPSPLADAEIILLALKIISDYGVPETALSINSIGCPAPECRPAYRAKLVEALTRVSSELCENCKKRMEKNPLRVLDCKECGPKIRPKLPGLELCQTCRDHFSTVEKILNAQGVKPHLDPHLVRGLDYYTRTVFEITAGNLGSQSAVCGGGRYDGLVELLGGEPSPATGFALGIDRLIQAKGGGSAAAAKNEGKKVFLIPLAKDAPGEAWAMQAAQTLRQAGIPVETARGGASMKSQMRQAGKSNATYAIIIGEDEAALKKLALKNLQDGSQQALTPEETLKTLSVIPAKAGMTKRE